MTKPLQPGLYDARTTIYLRAGESPAEALKCAVLAGSVTFTPWPPESDADEEENGDDRVQKAG